MLRRAFFVTTSTAHSKRTHASGCKSGFFLGSGLDMTTPEEQFQNETTAFHLAAGEVIREWAELEVTLIFHLSILLGTDQFRSRIIWESLPSGRPRFRMLQRLGETYLSDTTATKFRDFLKTVNTIRANRNMLAHSHGGVSERRNTLVFLWDEEGDDFSFNFLGEQTIQIRNVQDWARDIVTVRANLMDFLPEMRASVYASPKTHRTQPDGHTLKSDQGPSGPTPEGPPHPPQSSGV
jgi:hypothetical protein